MDSDFAMTGMTDADEATMTGTDTMDETGGSQIEQELPSNPDPIDDGPSYTQLGQQLLSQSPSVISETPSENHNRANHNRLNHTNANANVVKKSSAKLEKSDDDLNESIQALGAEVECKESGAVNDVDIYTRVLDTGLTQNPTS